MREQKYAELLATYLGFPEVWTLYPKDTISALIREQVAAEQLATMVRGVPFEHLSLVRESALYRCERDAAIQAHAEFKILAIPRT